MVGRTNVGGSGGASWDNAVIHIYAPAGSVITATKGGVTKPVKEHIILGQASEYFFYVKPADFGEWTISATHTTWGTTSKSVTIASNIEYLVRLDTRVPWAYQEVEYAQSTGAQKLEINYVTKQETVYHCKAEYTELNTSFSNQQTIFGNGGNGAHLSWNGWSIKKLDTSFGNAYMSNGGLTIAVNTLYDVEMSESHTIINGVEYSLTSSGVVSSTRRIFVFDDNEDSGGSNMKSKSKVHALSAEENGILVLDLVPCYLKSNPSTCGMFDTVNHHLYENIGTGNLIMGADVVI